VYCRRCFMFHAAAGLGRDGAFVARDAAIHQLIGRG
jgi:hypothetical protein